MDVKHLSSWKVTSTQPFYPIGIRCMADDGQLRAITTYTAHAVNTFIFLDFDDDIENNKPPHKSYLLNSFFPDRITDITVGAGESAILLENGRIKYFTSSKKLLTVEYLSGVKTICSTCNGFALIKTSPDGMDFFIEVHPDSFQSKPENVGYNISFEKILELQNTWHQCRFKLKELHFVNPIENQFLKTIIPDDDTRNEYYLFLSIDYSFCSVYIIDERPSVNPIVMCTTKIVDFWAANNGNQIILLLESGTFEILYLSKGKTRISKTSFYFGGQILDYHYSENIFMFSNGTNVDFGLFEFNAEFEEFKFKRKSFSLPGIIALTYLPVLRKILCVSENGQFYSISASIKSSKSGSINSNWVEVDKFVQKHLSNLKFHLIELTDAYDNLMDLQEQQQKVLNTIKLRRNDLKHTENDIGDSKYRFVATSTATKIPTIPEQNDSSMNMIYVSNSLVYDRKTSFFVKHRICYTVRYANEFDANLWSLCCRWLNDKHENVYANIKLNEDQLSLTEPLTLVIHLQQKHLPCFNIDISTRVFAPYGRARGTESTIDTGKQNNSSIHVNFPVFVDQPDYCEMMNISHVDEASVALDDDFLICTVLVPKSVSLEDMFAEKMNLEKCTSGSISKFTDQKSYRIHLLGRTLTATHYIKTETLRLITKDADLMHSFKKNVHRQIETQLSFLGLELNVKVSADIQREYCVSILNLSINLLIHLTLFDLSHVV